MQSMTVSLALAAALVMSAGLAMAQGGKGPGAAPAASSAAGPGGPGPGPGRRIGPRAGRDFTPGWSMMNRAEREEHRSRMADASTPEACRAARDEHRKLMEQRAQERGMKSLPQPRRDSCARVRS